MTWNGLIKKMKICDIKITVLIFSKIFHYLDIMGKLNIWANNIELKLLMIQI
jgi:hypothetical protein